ncbi:MAG: hypothetical protein Q9228_006162 [Teloschistes exilis]
MRHSISLVALALASAVFALPTPKDSSSDDSGFTRGDTTSGDDSDSSSSADSDITTSSSGLGDSSTTSSSYGSYPTTTATGSYQTTSSSGSLPTFTPSPTATPVNTLSPVDTATATATATGTAAFPTSTSASTSNSTSTTTTNLLACGSAQYDPLAYNCFDASFLCPIIAGHATFRCADACYLPDLYVCTDNQLSAASVTATGQTFPTGFPTGTMTLGGSGSGQTATATGTGAVETGLVFGSTTDRSSETSDEAASGTTDKRGYAEVW